jgi:hypothetical protein
MIKVHKTINYLLQISRTPPSLSIKFFTFLLNLEDGNWFCTCVLQHFDFGRSHTRSLVVGIITKTNYKDGAPSNLKITYIRSPNSLKLTVKNKLFVYFFWGGKLPPSVLHFYKTPLHTCKISSEVMHETVWLKYISYKFSLIKRYIITFESTC